MYISKIKLVLIGILATSLIIIVTAYSQKDNLSQGQQPYTPNRLEWLELQLNAKYSHLIIGEGDFIIRYEAIPEDNIVYALIWYPPDTGEDTRQRITNEFEEVAVTEILEMGWSDWCRVESKVGKIEEGIPTPIEKQKTRVIPERERSRLLQKGDKLPPFNYFNDVKNQSKLAYVAGDLKLFNESYDGPSIWFTEKGGWIELTNGTRYTCETEYCIINMDTYTILKGEIYVSYKNIK